MNIILSTLIVGLFLIAISDLTIGKYISNQRKAINYHTNELLPYETTFNQFDTNLFLPQFQLSPLIFTQTINHDFSTIKHINSNLKTTSSNLIEPLVFFKPTIDVPMIMLSKLIDNQPAINPKPLEMKIFSNSSKSFFGLPVTGIMTNNDNFDREKTIDELRAETINPLLKINLKIRHYIGQLTDLEKRYTKQSTINQLITKPWLQVFLHPV